MMTIKETCPWTSNKVLKSKQEWFLLDLMVDLFNKIEEGVKFNEAAKTPIPGVGGGGQYFILTYPQNWGDVKSCKQR